MSRTNFNEVAKADVDETMENYEEAISYLSEKEIISGYPDVIVEDITILFNKIIN